jgi:Arylsulfotransferase (ASST)
VPIWSEPQQPAFTRARFLRQAAVTGAALLVLGRSGAGTAFAEVAADPRTQQFVSRPDLVPPVVTVLHPAARTAPGHLFLAPSSGAGQRGAMIIDNAGGVVWFRPTSPKTVMNLRVALYRGQPVLTWWEGTTKHGLGIGEHVIVDRHYREIARFPAGNGLQSDLHELIVTPEGTALVTAYDIPTVNLASVGHGRGKVIEGVVQEIDIPSARVVFEWRSLDHVKVTESHAQVAPRFDYFHVNSIDVDSHRNLLVSARNTWAVYKIDRSSGKVLWRLGGKKSDFAMGKGTNFAWQHDARHHGDSDALVTLFDNAAAPQVEPQSRGLAIALDLKRKRATLAHQYVHRAPSMLAHALGSVQTQPNGNVLVGWGTEPYFTEYAADGTVLFDAKLPYGGENYRTLRFPWVGTPSDAPALAASGGTLYASWNGATEVASWQLLAGSSAAALTPGAVKPKQGFETMLAPPAQARFAAVVALDRNGKQLGRSAAVAL